MRAEERVAALHRRMERRRRNERRKTAFLGAACAGISVCLLLLIFGGPIHAGGTVSTFSGATMLFENAGGYVLTALLAFALGTVITLICRAKREGNIRRERRSEEAPGNDQNGGKRNE